MSVTPLSADIAEIDTLRRTAECLYSEQEVEEAIREMAGQITRALADANPLLLCVMNGGLVLSGRIAPLLDFPLQIDYLHATRYRGETRGAELNWLSYPREQLSGRPVLVVDDILDEGNTLKAVADYCLEQGATQVYSAVLVQKRHTRRIKGAAADCVGLEVDDKFIFGYGLDYKGYLRNAPGIFAIPDSALE
jgi:hypoxanthine phosphoribosyltransferase